MINNFEVLKVMGERNLDVRLAPLGNIVSLNKVRAGTNVTIGVPGDLVGALAVEDLFVGGLILANRKQFEEVRRELEKQPTRKSKAEIEAEIAKLQPLCEGYDSESETRDTILAVGAHDALRWSLGLAEDSISEHITKT